MVVTDRTFWTHRVLTFSSLPKGQVMSNWSGFFDRRVGIGQYLLAEPLRSV